MRKQKYFLILLACLICFVFPMAVLAETTADGEAITESVEGILEAEGAESEEDAACTEHSYELVTMAPTCTEQGYTTYTCSVCGYSYTDDYTEALGHQYEDGICTVCGEISLAKPQVTAANEAVTGKVTLSWEAVENAVEYKIYRSNSESGSYTEIAAVTDTAYTDTDTVSGKLYYYYVAAVAKNGALSEAGDVVTRVCDLPQPTGLTAANVASSGKIKLTWDTVEGAVKYQVYRSTSANGTYTLMFTTTGTSYTSSSAVAGTKYYYKVKAIASNTSANSAYSVSAARTCDIAQPVITLSNDAATGKVKVSWKAIEGAVNYKVYRSTSKNGTYTLMKTVTSTSYINSSAAAGKTYYYKVKAVASDTAANSAYSAIKSRMCDCARPVLKLSAKSTSSIKISWSKVTGASKYTVYRSTSKTGTYSKLGTTTSASYTDKTVKPGKTYYYKVIANGSTSESNSVASSIIAIKAVPMTPVMSTTVSSTVSSIKISWEKVSGASGYYVYRRSSASDSWKKVGTVTSGSTLSYTDKPDSGSYYYCVAAYKTVNGTKYTSAKSEAIRCRTLAKSKLTITQSTSAFENKLTWKKVIGATGYQVYYKTYSGGTWKKAATLGNVTSYTHAVTHGEDYCYRVRPIYKSNGVTSYGPYSATSDWYIHYYLPEFNVTMPSSSYNSIYGVIIAVQNTGTETMRFYAEDGIWLDGTSESYDRDIVLYDYTAYKNGTKKQVSYVDIGPGETEYMVIGVKSATRYNDETFIGMYMHYDGMYYVVVMNYNGGRYSVVE